MRYPELSTSIYLIHAWVETELYIYTGNYQRTWVHGLSKPWWGVGVRWRGSSGHGREAAAQAIKRDSQNLGIWWHLTNKISSNQHWIPKNKNTRKIKVNFAHTDTHTHVHAHTHTHTHTHNVLKHARMLNISLSLTRTSLSGISGSSFTVCMGLLFIPSRAVNTQG